MLRNWSSPLLYIICGDESCERQGVQEPLGSHSGAEPCPIKNSYVIHAFCRSRIGASMALSEQSAIPGRPGSGRRTGILENLAPFCLLFGGDARRRDPPDCTGNSEFWNPQTTTFSMWPAASWLALLYGNHKIFNFSYLISIKFIYIVISFSIYFL